MNFLMLLFVQARFVHARYSSRMIERFLNWGDHGKSKSGKIKGRCQPPLDIPISVYFSVNFCQYAVKFYSVRAFNSSHLLLEIFAEKCGVKLVEPFSGTSLPKMLFTS